MIKIEDGMIVTDCMDPEEAAKELYEHFLKVHEEFYSLDDYLNGVCCIKLNVNESVAVFSILHKIFNNDKVAIFDRELNKTIDLEEYTIGSNCLEI